MTKLSKFSLIYELRSSPANLMNLSQLFIYFINMIFETMHCLEFNVQCQKRHEPVQRLKTYNGNLVKHVKNTTLFTSAGS